MKIFEIGTGYTSIPARIGAATEIVVEELTTAMRNLGQNVSIIDIKDNNRKVTDLPITEVYMPRFFSSTDAKLGIVHKLKRVLYSISLTYKLHTLIRQNRDEKIILHFHNQYNLFFFLKLTPKSFLKSVTIGYTVHSYIWFGKWEMVKDTISKRYFQEIYCCQHADKVYVLNDIVSNMLVDHYLVDVNRIIPVINGVNVNVYNIAAADSEVVNALRKQYKLVNKHVIFQVGSICDRKNQLGTLKLLLPIMKKRKDIAFIYAGGIIDPGYAYQIELLALQEHVKDRVLYMGEVSPGKQLNDLYALSDVAILNSRQEAFALVVAEALSASKPIFICEEIFNSLFFLGKNEGKGIIRIKDTFIADLERLLEDKNYYHDMQSKGRNLIVNELSWEVAAQMYLKSFI